MDYQRVQDTRLTILYRPCLREGVRGYFSNHIASAINIGIQFVLLPEWFLVEGQL